MNSEESGVSEESGDVLADRLAGMAPERLAEEVISVWEEVIRLEEELATERQGRRALEMDMGAMEQEGSARAKVVELEESLRVSESRVSRLEVSWVMKSSDDLTMRGALIGQPSCKRKMLGCSEVKRSRSRSY